MTFALSLGYLLATSDETLEPLRGLSRWTLRFVFQGPDLRTTLLRSLRAINGAIDDKRSGAVNGHGISNGTEHATGTEFLRGQRTP